MPVGPAHSSSAIIATDLAGRLTDTLPPLTLPEIDLGETVSGVSTVLMELTFGAVSTWRSGQDGGGSLQTSQAPAPACQHAFSRPLMAQSARSTMLVM